MRARGSSYHRTEILLLLLAFPLVTAGCGPRSIWGTPRDALVSQLSRGQYAALAQVDLSKEDPGQSLELSPSAPFYLSFVFDALDKPDESLRMLQTAWRRSPSPWKEEAGLLLARRLLDRRETDEAIRVAREVSASSAPEALRQEARRVLIQALYWEKQDAGVLAEAARFPDGDPEVLMFRAVSSMRLGLPQARELTLRLFLSQRVSSLHGRMYTYLTSLPAYLQQFSAREQELLAGKAELLDGNYTQGIPAIQDVVDAVSPEQIADGALVADLGAAYAAAGRAAAGAVEMERLSRRLLGPSREEAEEQAGRLYRRAREYPKALSWLQAAARDAGEAARQDRVRGIILEILLSTGAADLPQRIASEAVEWNDTARFIDPLRGKIAELVSARRWSTLVELWKVLDSAGPPQVRAQLSYLIAREWQQGAIARLPSAVSARSLFQDAEQRDPMGYYGLLAASMLGDLPDRVVPSQPSPDADPDGVGLDPVATGFLAYGLYAQAYARLGSDRSALNEAQLKTAADLFARAGDYRSSLYFLAALSRVRRLTLEELRMFYPRPYAGLIEPLARQAGLDEHVIYALVREESFFDPTVVSRAGAVGLSQLMPSTAASVAQRLHILEPDLRDPSTNLALGIRHLQNLVKATGSIPRALLAYNAGLSRLRRWERATPAGLPADLFVESAAIAETREYVRKILVSSVMYAFLYRDADPRDAALSFFDLRRGPLEARPLRGPRHGGG